jgi:hypothetical protein
MNSRLAALDVISRILWVDKTSEDVAALRRQIREQEIDWPPALWTANQNLITPSLWPELLGLGLADETPPEIQNYLAEIHRLNTLRNQQIRLQTLEIAKLLNTIGIEPILLKGAASLFRTIYRDLGSRMLTDIDILLPRDKAMDCWELLRSSGYGPHGNCENTPSHPHPHHLHPLSRPGEYAVIELHHDVLPAMSSGFLFGATITEQNARRITCIVSTNTERLSYGDDHALRIPSWTSRVVHCLLHSAFLEANAYRSGILPLRSLHELALMQSSHGPEIDWLDIWQLLSGSGKRRPLRAWPYLAHRLFGSALPPTWKTMLPMRAHYWRCRWQARWGVSITLRHIART